MVFRERLAERIRGSLAERDTVREHRMFGGARCLAFTDTLPAKG